MLIEIVQTLCNIYPACHVWALPYIAGRQGVICRAEEPGEVTLSACFQYWQATSYQKNWTRFLVKSFTCRKWVPISTKSRLILIYACTLQNTYISLLNMFTAEWAMVWWQPATMRPVSSKCFIPLDAALAACTTCQALSYLYVTNYWIVCVSQLMKMSIHFRIVSN